MAQLRRDPVVGFWVVVAEESVGHPLPRIQNGHGDSQELCPLCEGHEAFTPPEIAAYGRRGQANSPGWNVRVVPNTLPVLTPTPPDLNRRGIGLFDVMNGIGAHEVVVETPRHDEELADMSPLSVNVVLQAFRDRIQDLHRDHRLRYVMVCKNRGPFAGARLAHAHSQIIALAATPVRVKDKLHGARAYYELKERCIYCDILRQELADGSRVVYENAHIVVLCPFASRFPFELLILPRQHQCAFCAITPAEQADLAVALVEAAGAIRAALSDPDYNLVLHTAPNPVPRPGFWRTIGVDFHWHVEFIPRIFSVAGFEWGTGCYINPTPPESAAEYLRQRRSAWARKEYRGAVRDGTGHDLVSQSESRS